MRMTTVELQHWRYDPLTKYLFGVVVTSEDELWKPGEMFESRIQHFEDRGTEIWYFSNTKAYRCPKAGEAK